MEENKFKCNECGKYYKSYQSLWNHKKRFHDQIMTNIGHNDIKKNDQNMTKNDQTNKLKKTENSTCEYCNKILSAYTHLRRHLKICKTKQNIIKQNEEIIKQQNEIIKQNNEIIKQNEEIINKTSSGLTTTNNNTTNNNTTNNNTNNGTINNNINIYNFGSEKILENLPKVEAVELLCLSGYDPVLRGLKITHFSKDNPEGHTIFINNIDDKNATIYDAKKGTTISEPIEISADIAIQNTIWDLEDLKEKHKEELNKKQINNIDNIVVKDYPPHITDKFKKMAYENKDMVKKTMEQIVASK
jgi:hypothetical protein